MDPLKVASSSTSSTRGVKREVSGNEKEATAAASSPVNDNHQPDDTLTAARVKEEKVSEKDSKETENIYYQPLLSQKEIRWRAAEVVKGAAELAGTWNVYACYTLTAGYDCDEIDDGVFFMTPSNIGRDFVTPMSGTLELNAPKNVVPRRSFSRYCADSGTEQTAKKVVPLLEGHLTLEGEDKKMPVTVLPPESFDLLPPESFESHYQRVGLGGLVDGEGRRLDGNAVFDATVDGVPSLYDWDRNKQKKAAALDVNGLQSSLNLLDRSKLDNKTVLTVKEDNQSLFVSDADPLVLNKGDLRLSVRWVQRGGHSIPGIGIAYLCRRDGSDPPPVVAEPCPLSFASQKELYEWQESNTFNDTF